MSIRLIDGSEFLHIPKTGGTWVREVLEAQGLIKDTYIGGHEHADYDRVVFDAQRQAQSRKPRGLVHSISRQVKRLTSAPRTTESESASKQSKPLRFCFVRHPLTWYESWWKYMNARGWNDWGDPKVAGGWHPNRVLNGLGSGDFNQFVRNVIEARPGYVSELFFSYAKPDIAFIGKTENLINDLIHILEHLGLPADVETIRNRGPANASKQPDQAIEWDPVVRQTLIRLELPALVYFGYLDASEFEQLGLPGTLKPARMLQRIAST